MRPVRAGKTVPALAVFCWLGACLVTGCSSGPGNGGGAPVVVSGWTCQGYDTPEVLRTGNASQCRSGGNAILAVLAVPDATKTAA